jgi:tetratricopeptide (TPR) repeat protein
VLMPQRRALVAALPALLVVLALMAAEGEGRKKGKAKTGKADATVDLSATFASKYAQSAAKYGKAVQVKPPQPVAPQDLPPGHLYYGMTTEKPSAAVLASPGYLEAATAVNAGVEQYQRGRYEEAKRHFLRGIELSNDHRLTSMAHVNVGMVCNLQMQYAEAATHFEIAVRMAPHDMQDKLDLGSALLYTGRFSEAYSIAKELLPHADKMGKSKQSVLTLYGNCQLTSADWLGAALTFQRITTEFPNFPSAHVGLGEAMEHLGRGAESVAAFRKALKATPQNDHAVLALGRTLLRFADYLGGDTRLHLEESIAQMNRYASMVRKSWATSFNVGVAHHRLQNWEAALEAYRETQWRFKEEHAGPGASAFKAPPGALGQVSVHLNKVTASTAQTQVPWQDRDEMVQVYFYEGEVCRKLQRYPEAIEAYLRGTPLAHPPSRRPFHPPTCACTGAHGEGSPAHALDLVLPAHTYARTCLGPCAPAKARTKDPAAQHGSAC